MTRYLAIALLLSIRCFGQGSLVSFPVLSPTGQALAGASVALCSSLPQAATPCGGASLQQTYTDITMGTPCALNPATLGPLYGAGCTNPGLADGHGNANINAAPSGNSQYFYQVYGLGIEVTYVSPIFFPAGFGYTVQVNGTGLTAGDTVNFNNTTPTAPSNGINVQFQTSRSGGVDRVSAAIVGDGNSNHCLNGTGSFGACLPAAQVGDTMRFNVNGDSAWDAVNMAQEVTGAYGVTGGNPVGFGALCGSINLASGTGTADVFPTATRRGGRTVFISAAASTSTVTGMICGQNGSNSVLPILAWNRFSMLFQGNLSSNIRYWLGLGTWNSGSATGTNSTAILNTTKYATDTPNSNTLGFRYSTTTDTNWQAVACSAGVACTVVNTGVAYDTNPHLFEMTTNAASTSVCYFIDNVQVTSPCITTNLPPIAGTADSLADMFWTGDNKNNSNTASATFYRMQISMK